MRSVACKLVLAVSDDGTLSLSLHLYMPPKSVQNLESILSKFLTALWLLLGLVI